MRQRSSSEKTRVARLGDLERSEKGGEKGSYPILRGNSSHYIGLYRATQYCGGNLVIKSGELGISVGRYKRGGKLRTLKKEHRTTDSELKKRAQVVVTKGPSS